MYRVQLTSMWLAEMVNYLAKDGQILEKKTLRLQNKVFVNGITAMLKKDFRIKKG